MKALLFSGLAAGLLSAAVAMAQEPSVPDVPTGPGAIRGRLVHDEGDERGAALTVVLYSLRRDGTPGLRQTESDARGQFHFEGISNDPESTYLIGTQFAQLPFGARVKFAPGQSEIAVQIAISDPLTDPTDVIVLHSEIRLDPLGGELQVTELHQLGGLHQRVVYVAPEQRSAHRPAFRGALPKGAQSFRPAQALFRDSLELRGEEVLYWGPVYPGEQQIEYQYRLVRPSTGGRVTEGGEFEVDLRGTLPMGSPHLRVLSPETGPKLRLPNFLPADPVERNGRRYQVLEARDLAPGASYAGTLVVPAARNDPSALQIEKVDCWVELDAAALTVSQELHLEVDGASPVAGSPESPLLRLELPREAELLGLSENAGQLGVRVTAEKHIELIGPIDSGKSTIGFRYRLPAVDDAAQLDLRFPRPVALLNVLIADTGVIVEDDRLHRKRPVRADTRTYLLREGFLIEAEEVVSLHFRALARLPLPRWAALAVILLPGAAVMFLLFQPLRPGTGASPVEARPTASTTREREIVYAEIRDLEHDFETGKVEADDYHETRASLRARAIELLAREQSATAAVLPIAPSVCPACGERITGTWRFCPVCGVELYTGGGSERTGTPRA